MSNYDNFVSLIMTAIEQAPTKDKVPLSIIDDLINFPLEDNNKTELLKMYHHSIFGSTMNNNFGEQSMEMLCANPMYYVNTSADSVIAYFTLKNYGLVMLMFTPSLDKKSIGLFDGMIIVAKVYNLDAVGLPYKVVFAQPNRFAEEIKAIQAAMKDPKGFLKGTASFDSDKRAIVLKDFAPQTKVTIHNQTTLVAIGNGVTDIKGNTMIPIPYFYQDSTDDKLLIHCGLQTLSMKGLGVTIIEQDLAKFL